MKYGYVKAPPGYTLAKEWSWGRKIRYYVSLGLLTAGVATFTTVAYPLITYQITYAPRLQRSGVLSPLPNSPVKTVQAQEPTVFVDEVVNTALDYTDSNTWFAGSQTVQTTSKTVITSAITISKLGIEQAMARNDHTDLKQSLIHYPGTANPGDLGNMVVFGHSVLPQFFNPKNYVTIFSTLHRLQLGDEIEIESEGARYTYKIYEMYETHPDDLSPLAQAYNGRYLTLITCTPPGTYLRRLIIKAYLL